MNTVNQESSPGAMGERLGIGWLMRGLSAQGFSHRWAVAVVVLLAAALGLRVAAMAGMPLVPEEAYYWMYSQHPSLSYFDHPPMVAWVIGAGTKLFGDTEFGVRFFVATLMLASSVLLYGFGRMWFGRGAALWAALFLQGLPIYYGTGLIATMDSALVFFWLVCLVGVSVALRRQRAWGWYLAGVGMGGAMLSKYTGVFLGLGALLAVLGCPAWRRHLKSVHPYLAALLAVGLFSPVLFWNAANDWASFRFQFVDRFANKHFNAVGVMTYLGFQLLVATPLVLAGLAWLYGRTLRKGRRLLTPRWLLALSFSLPLLLAMTHKSLTYDIHLNWTLPVYLSVLPAVAQLGLAHWRRARRRSGGIARPRAVFATMAGCLAVNVLFMFFVLAIHPRLGWISALSPWRELAAAVETVEEQLEAETGREPLIIAEGKYRVASVLAFYCTPLEHRVRASDFITSQWIVGGRGLGYPYWADPDKWRDSDCIIVDRGHNIERFAPCFQQFTVVVKELRLVCRDNYQIAIGRGRRN
jgi:dolichol-phosphate mannosyltransferase